LEKRRNAHEILVRKPEGKRHGGPLPVGKGLILDGIFKK
jgi:hypothetical protein